MGIANRDIKLENILLMDPSDRPTLKLCDFGYSKDEFMGSACKTMCGERSRLAPLCWAAQSAAAGMALHSQTCRAAQIGMLPLEVPGGSVQCLHRTW